ncbi:MAG: nucleotidyltransferase family protein [Nocardioides sp.]|uniref:nucleotidyltransferase family protein n=1 Tax=Nocardioides sp. TaxID=35761 RepID=UPI0039E426AC
MSPLPYSPAGVEAARSALEAVLHERPWALPAGVDADDFVAAVRRHRLETHLALGHLDVPDRAREAIAAVDRSQRLNALRLVAELFRARAVLTEAGIRSLAFKGPALGALAWGDFARRGFGDLDLLVSPDDVDSAFDTLEAAGWRHDGVGARPSPGFAWRYQLRTYYELSLFGERSMIDLHWRPMPTVSPFPEFDTLWERRAVVDIAGRGVDTLGNFDSLVHSMQHAAKDEWSYLRSIADVWRLAGLAEVWASPPRALLPVERRSLGIAVRQLGRTTLPTEFAAAASAAAAPTMAAVERRQAGGSFHIADVQDSPWLVATQMFRRPMWDSLTWGDRWLVLLYGLLPSIKLGGLESLPWWRALPLLVLRRWQRLRVKTRTRRAARGR